MSGHNQLLVNYTRQCRNLPSRLPAFCHNKVPRLHGKFYQETNSVEHRREHIWTLRRAKDSLKDDRDKSSDINLMQAIPGISPYPLHLQNVAHKKWFPRSHKGSAQTSKLDLLSGPYSLRPQFLQLFDCLRSEHKSGVQSSGFWLSLTHSHPQQALQNLSLHVQTAAFPYRMCL